MNQNNQPADLSALQVEQLKQVLLDIGRKAESAAPELNSGGCGVYAARLGRALQQAGYKVRCRVVGYGESVTDTRRILGSMTNLPRVQEHLRISHVLVQVEVSGQWWLVDSSHMQPLSDHWHGTWAGEVLKGGLSVREAEALASQPGDGWTYGWNTSFDRRKYMPKITRLIKREAEALPKPC